MATGIRKVFQQDIVNSSIMLGEAFCGKIEICVNGCDQVSQEDRTESLKKLETCLREAYLWTERQLGMGKETNAENNISRSGEHCVSDVIEKVNLLLTQAHENLSKANILLCTENDDPAETAGILTQLGITAALVDSLADEWNTLLGKADVDLAQTEDTQ